MRPLDEGHGGAVVVGQAGSEEGRHVQGESGDGAGAGARTGKGRGSGKRNRCVEEGVNRVGDGPGWGGSSCEKAYECGKRLGGEVSKVSQVALLWCP